MSSSRTHELDLLTPTLWTTIPPLWVFHLVWLQHHQYLSHNKRLQNEIAALFQHWDPSRGTRELRSEQHIRAWALLKQHIQTVVLPQQHKHNGCGSEMPPPSLDPNLCLGGDLMPEHLSPTLHVTALSANYAKLQTIEASRNSRVIRQFGWHRFAQLSFNQKNLSSAQLNTLLENGISLLGVTYKYFHGKHGENSVLLFAESFPCEETVAINEVYQWHLQLECPYNSRMSTILRHSRLDLLASKTIPTLHEQSVDGKHPTVKVGQICDEVGSSPERSVLTDGAAPISPSSMHLISSIYRTAVDIDETIWKSLTSLIAETIAFENGKLTDDFPCSECVLEQCRKRIHRENHTYCQKHSEPLTGLWRNTVEKIESLSQVSTEASFQGRFAGYKGVWYEDILCLSDHALVRPSMRKICMGTDDICSSAHANRSACQRQFEVLRFSHDSGSAFLNPQLLILLLGWGLKVDTVCSLISDTELTLTNCGTMDEMSRVLNLVFQNLNISSKVRDDRNFILLKNTVMELNYLYNLRLEKTSRFRNVIRLIAQQTSSKLCTKLHIPIADSRRLMIIPDPTGLLKPGEVFINLSGRKFSVDNNGVLCSESIGSLGLLPAENREVLLARNPSYHPEDVQIFTAVTLLEKLYSSKNNSRFCEQEVCQYESSLIDVAVLPITCGVRSASLLSGGDYDGDTVWACWDRRIVSSISKLRNTKAERSFQSSGTTIGTVDGEQPKSHQAVYLNSLEDYRLGIATNQHMEILEFLIGLIMYYKSNGNSWKEIEDFIPTAIYCRLPSTPEEIPPWWGAYQPEVLQLSELCKQLVDAQKHGGEVILDQKTRRVIQEIRECRSRIKLAGLEFAMLPLSRLWGHIRSCNFSVFHCPKVLESFSSSRENVVWKQLLRDALELVHGYNKELTALYRNYAVYNKNKIIPGLKLKWRQKFNETVDKLVESRGWSIDYANLQLAIACWQVSTQEAEAVTRRKPHS